MNSFKNECIYFAGPACFYPNGYDLWASMKKKAEYYGFKVSMPSDNELKLDHEDLRKNADTIFENCADGINKSTAIIVSLEYFRGLQPDGGSVFELGMAYARGLRCYGYTRDKRNIVYKHYASDFKDGLPHYSDGRLIPNMNIPFGPSIISSCRVIEGDFEDCLNLLKLDIEDELKAAAWGIPPRVIAPVEAPLPKKERPVAYLAGRYRFGADSEAAYSKMKKLCESLGVDAYTPMDPAPNASKPEADDPHTLAYLQFERCRRHIVNCDLVIADLNDTYGYEPDSDVAFECGMAWQMGKKCYGYMDNTGNMRDRVPHLGPNENAEYRDCYEYTVENFNYPINLMFASSIPILEGKFEDIAAQAVKEYFASAK